MRITLLKESYKGVDGSSLTETRRSQIVQVYEMLEEWGSNLTNYLDIKIKAQKKHLFGNTNAKSAIRTFFPLLKKIAFVNYDGDFPANKCFTSLGAQFVLASRAYENVEDDTPNKDKILEKLDSIIKKCQKQGLINMRLNPLYKNHNMWIAIKLFKEFGIVHWNEFLYTLHCLEIGETEEYAYNKIRDDRKKIDDIIFLNEKGENLPDTCYSYIRSYLVEAGLITKITNMEYRVLDSFDNFVSKLNI